MARITARPETADALRQILQDLVGPSRDEAGCLSYELFRNQDSSVEFVTVEQWVDQAAVDAHMATPHVATAISKAGDLLALPPMIHRFARLA
jgi:quinol monooxygenase YgiN